MELVKSVNLGVRFLLEILALLSYSYWGFRIFGVLLGLGAPMLVAVLWGLFGSPKANFSLQGFPRLLFEIVIFGGAAAALYFSGKQSLGILYSVVAAVNLVLLKIWEQ
ncbi:YrdB family protein [Neobacillus sp. LXY-1]|uniref:YrdB family protein n=1 Tax=Neobacillus sp. LXY-1 TaxID=3379133 RepID=UPI003EE274E4